MFYLLLALTLVQGLLLLNRPHETNLIDSLNADALAVAINSANKVAQLQLSDPISLEECSLYYTDNFAMGRDIFLNAVTFSFNFTSPCYLLTIELAKVLHHTPLLLRITEHQLRSKDLWQKYRSSKYSHEASKKLNHTKSF